MLAYSEYDKIKKLLKEEKFDELEAYIDNLCDKAYLELARKALSEYATRYEYYGYTNEGKLLLTNYYTAFRLNDDKILTSYRRDRLKKGINCIEPEKIEKIDNIMNLALENEKIKVGKIVKDTGDDLEKYYKVSSIDGSIIATYRVVLFDYLEKFLGRNVTYTLSSHQNATDIYTCVGSSDKGTGIILPVKVKK